MRSTLLSRCRAAAPWLLTAALALSLAQPAAAQWKWRDATGRVTASDMPPPRDVPEKDIIQRPGSARPYVAPPAAASAASAAATAAPRASAPVDKELEARRRAAEQQAQAKTKAEEARIAAVRAENCARARSYLQTLDSGMRIARTNDKGEREILDDQARAAEARRARDTIASDCR